MDAFGKYREAVVPLMLERLKERKSNVTDAIGAALDAVFVTVSYFLLHIWFWSINLITCADLTGQYNP